MDLFRKCMEPVEKCLRDAKMDKSSVCTFKPLSSCLLEEDSQAPSVQTAACVAVNIPLLELSSNTRR